MKLQELQAECEQMKIVAHYNGSYENERQDIAEVITDNKILMGRVDLLLKEDGIAKVCGEDMTESIAKHEFSNELVDELYE
jgi:hypothetical protein